MQTFFFRSLNKNRFNYSKNKNINANNYGNEHAKETQNTSRH